MCLNDIRHMKMRNVRYLEHLVRQIICAVSLLIFIQMVENVETGLWPLAGDLLVNFNICIGVDT